MDALKDKDPNQYRLVQIFIYLNIYLLTSIYHYPHLSLYLSGKTVSIQGPLKAPKIWSFLFMQGHPGSKMCITISSACLNPGDKTRVKSLRFAPLFFLEQLLRAQTLNFGVRLFQFWNCYYLVLWICSQSLWRTAFLPIK